MLVKRGLGIDVVTAARQRIIETFKKGRLVRLSFSGGKDSLVLADIIYNLIIEGKIDKNLLLVVFIDEEAMYEELIEIVKKWRIKFMSIGVKFIWYCLQVKHFNCLNTMTNNETFICWDKDKKDVWVRQMPDFAVTDDKFLIPYKDNYQAFLDRQASAYNMISMRGIRVAESVQRLSSFTKTKTDDISTPIYDMSDKDVWLYLLRYNIEYPKVYENLYRVGTSRRNLRISQFFSIDTARTLVTLNEMYPDLMERVTRREPNAYLCALYWDTEMFGRSTRRRRELESDEEKKDYKALALEMIKDPNAKHMNVVKNLKPLIITNPHNIDESDWKAIYTTLLVGDPKDRTCRAIMNSIFSKRYKNGKGNKK